MDRWKRFLLRNRIYAGMLVLVLLFHLAGFRSGRQKPAAVPEPPAVAETIPGEKPVSWETILDALTRKPSAVVILGTVAVLGLGAFMTGLSLAFSVLALKLEGKSVPVTGIPLPPPAWKPGDVIRAAIAFLFFGTGIQLAEKTAFVAAGAYPLPEPAQRLFQIANGIVFDLVGLAVVLYFVRVKYRQPPGALGLTPAHWRRGVFLGAAGYLTVFPLLFAARVFSLALARRAAYQPPLNPVVEILWQEKRFWPMLLIALFICLLGPLIEEIFFRGFVYGALKTKWGIAKAVFFSSVLFSLLHLNPVDLLPILALGMALAYLYEKTGSLVTPFVLHAINNSAAFAFFLLLRHLFG